MPSTGFATLATSANVTVIPADFDGDGRTDLALTGGSLYTTMPMAFSNGDGTFAVSNNSLASFPVWASSPDVQVHAGDFNADGRADLALTGVLGWSTLPVAFSTGRGTFNVTNQYVGDFQGWARSSGAKIRAADFNGDGRTDLAITGVQSWRTMPVARSLGDGRWAVSNPAATGFPDWSAVAGTTLVLGDFNRSRWFDLALTGGAGWTTLPIAFSGPPGEFSVINMLHPAIVPFEQWRVRLEYR